MAATLRMPARKEAFLALRLAGAAAAFCGLAGCQEGTEGELIIGGEAYRFPAEHVTSIATEPHQFVRLSPPQMKFDLVYDSRLDRLPPRRAIYSISDGPYPTVRSYGGSAGLVLCRRASHPNGGCGLSVEIGGGRWSVLFPETRLAEAAAIRDQAVRMLEVYRAAPDREPLDHQ